MNAADFGVVEAGRHLAGRELSARELTEACLERIRERDGTHSHDGDDHSINAWVRVYEDDALAAATRADERLAAGGAPVLCGIPIGLKDLYAVAGKPLTASSRLLDETPERDCDVWAQLAADGMVLLGHLHTHEFAVGGTTDQVGNPWALGRSAGGSSGGSAAALAARMTPAATGTDTAGSLRIPSAACGTSTIKPTRGLISLRGVVPLAPSLDHAGPMAHTVEDCRALFVALAGTTAPPWAAGGLAGLRVALSPRIATIETDGDVTDGVARAAETLRTLGAEVLDPPAPQIELDLGSDFLDVLRAELLVYHRRFDDRRQLYRPALREWVEGAEQHAVSAEEYAAAQERRRLIAAEWDGWFERERVVALLEPTMPVVAPPRGAGYDHAGSDAALISFTHYWNWTGTPVVSFPAGLGKRSGLPVGVSLVGRAGADWELLDVATQLQQEMGVPALPNGNEP